MSKSNNVISLFRRPCRQQSSEHGYILMTEGYVFAKRLIMARVQPAKLLVHLLLYAKRVPKNSSFPRLPGASLRRLQLKGCFFKCWNMRSHIVSHMADMWSRDQNGFNLKLIRSGKKIYWINDWLCFSVRADITPSVGPGRGTRSKNLGLFARRRRSPAH